MMCLNKPEQNVRPHVRGSSLMRSFVFTSVKPDKLINHLQHDFQNSRGKQRHTTEVRRKKNRWTEEIRQKKAGGHQMFKREEEKSAGEDRTMRREKAGRSRQGTWKKGAQMVHRGKESERDEG